jgi:hypothetical protein
VANAAKKIDLPVAVARFVWMMSASDRLADIAFYEPKVAAFSDDGIMVPGSSYGRRIRQAHPGIDQLVGAIERLKEDPISTRRAAISIYQPTDTTRDSNDIPCAFGLIYHGRAGVLNATTIMRSNNAIGLLPFNLFEFSLLAEVVAAEADLEVGSLHHFAGSMHYYDEDFSAIASSTAAAKTLNLDAMPAMPRDPKPLEQVKLLILLETEMRQKADTIRAPNVDEWRRHIQNDLHTYWQQLGYLLLLAIARKNGDVTAFRQFKDLLNPNYGEIVGEAPASGVPQTPGASVVEQLFKPGSSEVHAAPQLITRSALNAKVVNFCKEHEKRTGARLGADVAFAVQAEILDRLAARKDNDALLTQEEFDAVLASMIDR